MLQIGLTGGIGSGKSFIAEIFSRLSIPVYNSDNEARLITDTNYLVKNQIIENFGQVYEGNRLKRKELASIVFGDEKKLQLLNSIVHPAVKKHYQEWLKSQNTPYIIKEAAILIDIDAYKELDKIILVTAPEELRIQRVIQRDKTARKDVLSRMQKQLSDEEKRPHSDFEIVNDEKGMLLPQIIKIHNAILECC